MHEQACCHDEAANHQLRLLNHWNSFHRGMFKLNTKFDADLLLYSLSHFECSDHTVHMLTHQSLPPPLTSTVKSSLFTHVHSSPLSLAARLHQCCTNHSRYINSGWTFSGQTLHMWESDKNKLIQTESRFVVDTGREGRSRGIG